MIKRHGKQSGAFLVLMASSMASLFLSGSVEGRGSREVRRLNDHVPNETRAMTPMRRVLATEPIPLVLVLPLRNKQGLIAELKDIYDPQNPHFRKYLTPAEFAARYGPTNADYVAVQNFANENGLSVTRSHLNRTLINVVGQAADVEKTFALKLNVFHHPVQSRNFIAPDSEPAVPANIPIVKIIGLNTLRDPQPIGPKVPPIPIRAVPHDLPGPNSTFTGPFAPADLRAAYAGDVSLTGAGQTVAIYSDNFWISVDDINKFQDTNGISPRVPVQVKLVQPLTELPPAWGGIETVLDAEMAIAMAPGLSQVIIYMGDMTTALNQAANEALAKQISVSYSGIPNDDSYEAIMMQFAAEGITVVASSGDDGAYYPTVPQWQSSPSVTIVGGTVLTTASPAGKWISEQVWNPGGGGISASYSGSVPIPTWQANISTAQNGASKTMRNSPDVAMVASNVSFYWRGDGNGAATVAEGTSVSAPLWAGVIALANQRAAALKKPSVGAINRAIYTIGLGANAGKLLHDITVGNNVTPDNTQPGAANQWDAVAGYDMASGLGTPVGEALLEALVTPNVPPPPVNCVATKELIASLQMQRDKAESQLGTPLCDGPASYECVQRIKALQAEISAETLFYNENCSH